jgi:hypothetical protein
LRPYVIFNFKFIKFKFPSLVFSIFLVYQYCRAKEFIFTRQMIEISFAGI